MVAEAEVSADTQSALLLSAPLWKHSKDGPSPLTPVEYAELVRALFAENMRPRDLLAPDSKVLLTQLLSRFPAKMREQVTGDRIARLLERGGQLALALSRWTSAGIWVASRADANYPSRLKRALRRSTPPIIYGVGPAALLERAGLAVVGSRKPDESSERFTADVGRWAASADVQIVSGAARGIDENAMLACIDAGGTALGVVAESLLRLSTRREFREAILSERLTLISSFDPDTGFNVANAMSRNRWIYALADRALVIACTEGSGGTWAGATEALKHDVPVYVRTGVPQQPGNDALVRLGALPAPTDLSVLWNGDVSRVERAVVAPSAQLPALESDDQLALELVRLLSKPMGIKRFAAKGGLSQVEAAAWLKRLMTEGSVAKIKASYRAVRPEQQQQTLF